MASRCGWTQTKLPHKTGDGTEHVLLEVSPACHLALHFQEVGVINILDPVIVQPLGWAQVWLEVPVLRPEPRRTVNSQE